MVEPITPQGVLEARRDLGRQLAGWRTAAGLTQAELAKEVCYSQSTVANVEIGRDVSTRQLWQNADSAVGARGALLAAFDQAAALVRDFRVQQAARLVGSKRQERALRPAVPDAPTALDGCRCGKVVVGRWTRREIRALREALRMTVHDFAERLGVSAATVLGWERQRTPTSPKMATQSMLDHTLNLADSYAQARFLLILQAVVAYSGGHQSSDY